MADRVDRRLAAIVALDVVGYARLMGADEPGTIAAVRALQSAVLDPVLARFGGRMVKTMGDGFLVEFTSAVAAVEAASDIQLALTRDPDTPRLRLRIGVHVGDIVIDGSDIFGEGVNIAARIEPLAAPGGIAISDDAHRQVRDRVDLAWVDGGEQEVKNIARPVRVWHWDRVLPDPPESPALPLPDRPSLAVLPFDNMSGDPEQAFFADGMTEDLITDLSKVSGLFVVARNSTFVFKGQAVDVPDVARRLGVRHVIEGSVRKVGSRVRINVQLIDGATGGHVWADRFDGSLDDVFELQDSVCARVVEALSVRLTPEETWRLAEVHTRNLDAYELYVRAKATPYPPIPDRIAAAREMFAQVVELDPDFAGGYAGLAWMTGFAGVWAHGNRAEMGAKAEALARKAIAVDDSFGWGHTVLGLASLVQRRHDDALAATRRGIELLPNDADAYTFHALISSLGGDTLVALEAIATAIRLNPQFINGPYLNVRAQAHFLNGDYAAAIASYEANVARGGPVGPPALCWAAASYHAVGDTAGLARTLDHLAKRFGAFRLQGWNFLTLFRETSEGVRIHGLMQAAGVPD